MRDNPYSAPGSSSLVGSSRAAGDAAAPFSVHCECGMEIAVRASDAGGTVACECGRVVAVPRLSLLRKAQGLAAFETSVRDVIARKIAANELPEGMLCAVSGFPTKDIQWFDIHCETTYAKGGSKAHIGALILIAFISWPIALLLRSGGFGVARDADRLGRETVVAVPLRVKKESQPSLRRWASQRRLRQLLSAVPEYNELLRDYPQARIFPR